MWESSGRRPGRTGPGRRRPLDLGLGSAAPGPGPTDRQAIRRQAPPHRRAVERVMLDSARDEALKAGDSRSTGTRSPGSTPTDDGSIEPRELERAVKDAADLELIVRLGRREPGQATIERPEGPGGRPPFGAPGLPTSRGPDAHRVRRPPSSNSASRRMGPTRSRRSRAILEARFRAADLDNNGYLDRNRMRRFATPAEPHRAGRPGRRRQADESEWRAHLDLQAEVLGLRTVLQASEQGRSFLDLLDENRDRRLGVREHPGCGEADPPRRSGRRRSGLPRGNSPGTIDGPSARGQASTASQPPSLADQRPTRPGNPVAGPGWFLKMDRNRDGDISPASSSAPARPSRTTTPIGTA